MNAQSKNRSDYKAADRAANRRAALGLDDLTRSERGEVIGKIAARVGITRRDASRRELWVHPWVNGQRNVAVGRYLPQKVGGGFSVDFEIVLFK